MSVHGAQYHGLVSHPAPRRPGRWSRFYWKLRRRYRDKIVRNHIDLLRTHIQRFHPRSVLEIGAGSGRVLRALLRHGDPAASFEGIDLPDAHSVQDAGLPVRAMDARDLRYGDRTFDLVYALHTAEHLTDLRGVLSEVARILVPGGHLLLMVPIEPIRGSHAFMESLSLTGHPLRAWRMARRLHVRRVGPVPEYRFGREHLRLERDRWVFKRWLSPERLLLYRKAAARA